MFNIMREGGVDYVISYEMYEYFFVHTLAKLFILFIIDLPFIKIVQYMYTSDNRKD